MPVNVRVGDREQLYLMPPPMADWLPEDHLAFFGLDVVTELDLSAFYAAYREDGRGGATYDPAMMLALLIYAYCSGERFLEADRAAPGRRRCLSAGREPDA